MIPHVAVTLVDQDPSSTSSMGILNVSVGLVQGLAAQARAGKVRVTVLAHEGLRPMLPPEGPGIGIRCREKPPRRWGRVAWDLFGVARALRATGASIHCFPKGFLPVVATGGRSVALVHDRMFAFYASQGWAMPGWQRRYFAFLQDRTLRVADVVVTTTAAVAAEVAPSRRGPTVPIGVGPTRSRQLRLSGSEPGSEAPVLVLVSPHPHKRTAETIALLRHWRAVTASPRPVVGVGRLPKGVSWPAEEGWTLHPRLGAEAFDAELGRSALLLYLSAYEGYGLPPREALEAGIRTLASDIPALREHLPEEVLFAGGDPAEFSRRLDLAFASPVPTLPWPTPSWEAVAGRLLSSCG